MSGVAVVRTLLLASANVLAAVPATKIQAGVIPLNTTLPAISVQQVSAIRRHTAGMNGAKVLVTERVQVTAMTKTYPLQKSILDLVMVACRNRNGTVGGVDLDSILPDIGGPDFSDTELTIYMGSQDFIVKFRASA